MNRRKYTPDDLCRMVGYRPHPGQAPIHRSRARYRVAVCGRRWGKSSCLAAHECERYVMAGKPCHVWVVAPTYDHTDKVFRAVYEHICRVPLYRAHLKSMRRTPYPRLEMQGGGVLEGKSADHPTSLVGEGVDFLVVDEAAKIRGGKRIWEQYLQPSLADKHGKALFISTPEGFNWLYDLYARGQDPDERDWASWRSPTWVNTHSFPGGRDDPEIRLAERTLTEAYFNQEYGADFTALTGRVYKEFAREAHVIDALPDGAESWTRYRAIDFGYTNPFCCLWVAEDGDGRWYVYDEHYQGGWTYEDHAAVIKARGMTGFARTLADPADPQGISQLTQLRVHCEPARTTKSTGIELVRQRLKTQPDGRPRLFVLRHCKHTVFEFENYRYPDQQGDGNLNEQPVKKDDHAMDCLKNLAVTLETGGRWQQVR